MESKELGQIYERKKEQTDAESFTDLINGHAMMTIKYKLLVQLLTASGLIGFGSEAIIEEQAQKIFHQMQEQLRESEEKAKVVGKPAVG